MVRSPCCEMMGLKKGPWTIEEDQILVSHIQRYGHDNWRALPKQAGLLRCGKSCRLRWINYLRPDIKRGNFTAEEEEMIIKLHEMLGNRWSAIAARLPGRTDNEIKNVWHTHLKKRLDTDKTSSESKPKTRKNNKPMTSNVNSDTTSNVTTPSPQSSNDFSSSNPENVNEGPTKEEELVDFSSVQTFDIDESFWLEALSVDNSDPLEEESFPKVFENDDGMNYFFNLIDDIGEFPEF